jgi:XrtJ-associated TM-motif-TM protein
LTNAFSSSRFIGEVETMNKSVQFFLLSALFLSIAAPLRAQSGCADSPENPTVVLALVGSAGALFSTIRARVKARRNSSPR